MCHKRKMIAATLLAQVGREHFYSEESIELFESIKRQMHETGEPPSFRLVLEDPDISEPARQHFRDSVVVVTTVEQARKAASTLNKYRKRRAAFNAAVLANDALKQGNVDVDGLLERMDAMITDARGQRTTSDSFVHFGRNSNTESLFDDILWGDSTETLIPSGVEDFDEVAGGFARGSLVTIGANSGGGKSTVALAMAMKQAALGYKVIFVPLEMSKKEMGQRVMANLTKTDLMDVIQASTNLSEERRRKMKRRVERWEAHVKSKGGRLTIFKPPVDMTIEEVYASLSAYKADVVYVDYISLLKDTDGDDMWRKLGAIARYAKINAEVENRVNVLLCQVDDGGKIRYARAISEHSSNSWIWTANDETKETGITPVDQPKSRMSLKFKFNLKIVYKFMRIERAPKDDSLGSDPDEQPTKRRKKSKLPNLAEEV